MTCHARKLKNISISERFSQINPARMVDRKYTAEELVSDGVSKKDIVNELHGESSAAGKFLVKELKVRVAFFPCL